MPVNPYEKYKQQSVMTMTQGEMLLMLYDGTIKQLTAGSMYIEQAELDKASEALIKAQRIINYLSATLDHKYEISSNLAMLYDFFVRKIVSANVKKDAAPIAEILPMITELRTTFAQADKQSKTGTAAPNTTQFNQPDLSVSNQG